MQPGSRVVVPVRGSRVIGIVTATGAATEPGRSYKAILEAPDDEPSLPPALLATAGWMARHYAAPPGLVLRSALPTLLNSVASPAPRPVMRRLVSLTRPLESLAERDDLFRRAPKQREVWELLEALGGRAPVEHLQQQLGVSPSVITALARRGLVALEREPSMRDAFAARAIPREARVTATPAQREAIDRMAAAAPGTTFLLHGITGSGKTLVYIELLKRVTAGGKGAIVLVPEIALTPQTVDRFRAAFGDHVAVLHSGLSDGERLDAWRAIRQGERRIVVGARSAIFAPLVSVAAIIVDEEHEASYKQAETPRYHARDVAIKRAALEGGIAVLGSATPSLESWHAVRSGAATLVSLPDRVGGGRLPAVEVVDLRGRSPAVLADPFRRVISEPLESALAETMSRNEQSILLLNRRGFSAFVQCGSCGDVVACPNCSISLTVHRTPERLVCHYCAHAEPIREACAKCGQPTSRERGIGTQQVERLLLDRFPSAHIARMDVDTTTGKWAHAHILDRVARGEVDILLGTQMIAKGLDFPNVTLVGVIDADIGMNLPDFRASERTFQLVSQVAGRAGRGPKGGRVFIQTRLPDHHAIRAAVAHDFAAFARQELGDRAQPAYPPLVRLANIVFSGTDEAAVARLAERGAGWLRQLVSGGRAPGVEVVGPAPCAIERIKTRWRWHALIRSREPDEITRVIRYFAQKFEVEKRASLRVAIDRDPVSLL